MTLYCICELAWPCGSASAGVTKRRRSDGPRSQRGLLGWWLAASLTPVWPRRRPVIILAAGKALQAAYARPTRLASISPSGTLNQNDG